MTVSRNGTPQLKVVVVGDHFVGKTSLLHYLIKEQPLDNPVTTTSIYLSVKEFNVNGRKYDINIWDTAGEEQYHSLTSVYLRSSRGVLIVFDLTNFESFKAVEYWINFIFSTLQEFPSIVLVGNKCDSKEKRQVPQEKIDKLCSEKNVQYIETSAITGANVKECFTLLVNDIVMKLVSLEQAPVDNRKLQTKESSCC